jgi:hypothetical protein
MIGEEPELLRRQMVVTTGFQVGDRVRLSELGKSRAPRVRVQTGSVVKLPTSKSGRAIGVLFDGNKLPTLVHRTYIERESAEYETGEDRSRSE